MHSSNVRDKIFKSWSGINELTIIKEVATKGEHIQLCIEYWAGKRKIPESEYLHYFYDVVENYVKRLLSERLICKAEQVLRNVNRNVNCFFFQFAKECSDEELQTFVFDYLTRKTQATQHYDEEEEIILQSYWTLLELLRGCPALLSKYRKDMPRVSIEALMKLPVKRQQELRVALYFASGNKELLLDLCKFAVWSYLVESQDQLKLIRWCMLDANECHELETLTDIEAKFMEWKIEPDMYEYALKNLKEANEPLRICFVRAGFFFNDDLKDIPNALRRLCTAESLTQQKDLIERLPIAEFLLERGAYDIMLQPFVSLRKLEELCDEQNYTLRLVIALKKYPLDEQDGFMQLLLATKTYLAEINPGKPTAPLVTFYELLSQGPSVSELQSFLSYSDVPYLKALAQHFEPAAKLLVNLPTPHEMFRKFKYINLDELRKADPEIASFSNKRLCQRYARKYHLNYTHYLKQLRGAYAVYFLVMEQFQLYSQLTRTQLFNASETAIQLVLQHADNKDLVTHCIAFCEILGFDTQNIRNFLLLRHLLPTPCSMDNFPEIVRYLDGQLLEKASDTQFPLQDYQALLRLAAANPNCEWPNKLLKRYAAQNDWWHLLVLAQYSEVPLNELQKLLPHFKTRTLGANILRALSYDPGTPNERGYKRGFLRYHIRRQSSAESVCCSTNSLQEFNIDADTGCFAFEDFFSIILNSDSNHPATHVNGITKFLEIMQSSHSCLSTDCKLLYQSVKHNLPSLAVLAATVCCENVEWCWFVWLVVITEQWQDFLCEATHLIEQSELIWSVIKRSVCRGQTNALYCSFSIFYQENPFIHFCRFLQLTHSDSFGEDSVSELRLFLLGWSNADLELPLCGSCSRDSFMQHCINLLIVQLQSNFDTPIQQQWFLDCICRSDMTDICSLYDFCLLHQVFSIASTWLQQFHVNFELLAHRDSKEYARILSLLMEEQAYDVAVELATLLQQPVSNIFYAKWITLIDAGVLQEHHVYECEVVEHALAPEILVNFYLYAAVHELKPCKRKYIVLKRALDVIKQHHLFPNESFDRDQIEYDMIWCYLQIPEEDELKSLELYHSEYFEQIMLHERCVLYKSFLELKELAGIEDLSISAKSKLTPEMETRLEALLEAFLDKGDIVAALRVQELFEYRPTDLRFIVFCMALAEGYTTIYSMTLKERQLLSDIEKCAFAQFNKRTLQQLASPYRGSSDLSDSFSLFEFEEIPSKEKQQTLETIQGIVSKMKHGVELGKRIVQAYRAAMYLDKEYMDVLRTKDVAVLLKSAAEEDCLQRLLVVSDILNSTRMTAKEIADMLALKLITCIIRPRFYIFNSSQQPQQACKNADLWGYNIDRDFHLLLELTPNTTILGNCLLEYCDGLKSYRKYQDDKPYENNEAFKQIADIITRYGQPTPTNGTSGAAGTPQVLSHKKHNQIYVELLIKAHQCFVHECSMEGIANVLNRTKKLNTLLTKAKSWSLIVRMLIGIARYREMFYCFDALIENDQFESLLGQFSEAQKLGLRQAVLAYLREHNPGNCKELLRLTALHFLMYNELAEMWVNDAREVMAKVRTFAQVASQPAAIVSSVKTTLAKLNSVSAAEIIPLLKQALECYTHATENYLLDNKLLMAQQTASMAELVAMQIDLITKCAGQTGSSCVCVINVQNREEFRDLVNMELSMPQILILSRAYGYDVNWSEVLLTQFIIMQRKNFLKSFQMHCKVTDNIIENTIKGYLLHARENNINHAKTDEFLTQLVELIRSITLKYKLASILGLKAIVMSLINDSTVYYLRDTNFGHDMHDL